VFSPLLYDLTAPIHSFAWGADYPIIVGVARALLERSLVEARVRLIELIIWLRFSFLGLDADVAPF